MINTAFRVATLEATYGVLIVREGDRIIPCGNCREPVLAGAQAAFEGVICEVCTDIYLS